MNKVDVLRNIAHTAELRNRSIEPNIVIFSDGNFVMKKEDSDKEVTPEPQYSSIRCDCGNQLTVEDRGYRCRQCVLANAWTYGPETKKGGIH